MKNQEQLVQEEMRKLITKSCATHNSEYYKFQKSLLKFFFGAIDATIDYDEQTIMLWNSKPMSSDAIKLYDINEAVSAKVAYTNLEETLKGCLENGAQQLRFYKTLLFHYNNVKEDIGTDAISA